MGTTPKRGSRKQDLNAHGADAANQREKRRMKPDLEHVLRAMEKTEISSIRQTLNRIVEIHKDPKSGAFDLKNAIETDPPLAARVLKRANSVYYGGGLRISGILDAIVCIGFEAVKELALSQAVCALFKCDKTYHGYSRAALWRHCVGTALCCRYIYRREYQLPGGKAHAAGLLHDIGIIVEDQCLHEPFLQVLKDFSEDSGPGLYEHERRVFGFSHADIGRRLAERWNFSGELSRAIGEEFVSPDIPNAQTDRLSVTVRVASWVTQSRHIGFVETPCLSEAVMHGALAHLGITPQGLDFIMDEVESEMEWMHNEGWFYP